MAHPGSGGTVRVETIDPGRLGIAPAVHADLVGGNAEVNAEAVRAVLSGAGGAVRDIVLLNAAAAAAAAAGLGAVAAARTADPAATAAATGEALAKTLSEGLARAAAAVDSGAAGELLARWVDTSSRLGAARSAG